MSTGWYAAFALLALLSVANAIVLVATLRQIGVLHQRLRPTGPGTHEGPQIGQELPIIPLERLTGDRDQEIFATPITVLAYVTPGCRLCATLPDMVRAYLRQADHDVRIAFATDVPSEAARLYAEESALPAPMLQNDALAKVYELPGSPYVLALAQPINGNTMVLRAGVVNTLEQFEDLVDGAAVQLASLRPPEREEERSSLMVIRRDGAVPVGAEGEDR